MKPVPQTGSCLMADNRAETVPFRGGGFKHKPAVAVSMMVFVVLILFWELGSRTGWCCLPHLRLLQLYCS